MEDDTMANNEGGLKVFLEDKLGIRIRGKPDKSSDTSIDPNNTLGDALKDIYGSAGVDLTELNKFRTMATDRETQYRMYDEMDLDSIVSTTLEMYADDATQFNSKGQVIWVESDDPDVAAFGNRLIDVLGLNEKAWSHIYAMCKYGDLYLETFRDDEGYGTSQDDMIDTNISAGLGTVVKDHRRGAYLEEYVEAVSNPAEIYDLTSRGKTTGFIKINNPNIEDKGSLSPRYSYQHIEAGEETIVYPPDKYVHICLAPNTERFPEKLRLQYVDEQSEVGYREYTIKRGKSVLHDIYKIYKELSLMEDSVLMNRVTRSSIIRILQVEVGDMPKSQARELLKRIKQIVEQKNFMDKTDGSYQSMSSPGPIDNIIYVPTHEGKGNISMANIGGDVDVKSIADIEYYLSKLAGSFKIPIGYLKGSSGENGLAGGQALTKLDSRYARTIKRMQNAYISGITTLLNIFAMSRGLSDHINNFTVKMVSPSTVEDSERDEALDNHANMIGTILELLSDENIISDQTRKDVLVYYINNLLGDAEVGRMVEDDDTVDKNNADESSLDDVDSDSDFGGRGNFSTNIDTGGDDFGGLDSIGSESDTLDLGGNDEIGGDIDLDTNNTEDDFGDFTDEY